MSAARSSSFFKDPLGLDPKRDDSTGLKWSLILHGGLLLFLIIKTTVFPGKAQLYIPTLKVDLVALPDVLKKDLQVPIPEVPVEKKEDQKQKVEEEPETVKSKEKPKEVAKPEEMALKPKPKDREKKMKSALDRIKALEKISEATKKPQIVKGNILSKGSSLDPNAREGSSTGYPDRIREKLQERWALPIWLARQKFSAQALVFIDSRGRVTHFKFVKVSGNKQFDELVKRTIQDSQPFPAPPADMIDALLVDGILVGFPL